MGIWAIPENSGTLLSWEEVLEGKHGSVHTQTSLDQCYTPGTALYGQDSQHLPFTLWEPSPSSVSWARDGILWPISQRDKERERRKAALTPLQLFLLLGNKRKQEWVREEPRPHV